MSQFISIDLSERNSILCGSENKYYHQRQEQRPPPHWGAGSSLTLRTPVPSLCCPEQAKWCRSLCNSMDHSQSGSSVHVILQTRILEGVAMPSSRGSGDLPNPGIRPTSYVSCIGRQVLYHWRHLGSPTAGYQHVNYTLVIKTSWGTPCKHYCPFPLPTGEAPDPSALHTVRTPGPPSWPLLLTADPRCPGCPSGFGKA